MGAECTFYLLAVDDLGARPAFGRAKDDHRPAWPAAEALGARLFLDAGDLRQAPVQGPCHLLMHELGLMALDIEGGVAVAAQERVQLVMRQAREDGGARDLVAVEMENGEHSA